MDTAAKTVVVSHAAGVYIVYGSPWPAAAGTAPIVAGKYAETRLSSSHSGQQQHPPVLKYERGAIFGMA